jgi:hypothetical protein
MSKGLTVSIPPQGSDRPSWMRVGVLALVGFVIGVAWPKIAGVKIGPNVPSDILAASSIVAGRAPEGPPASATAPAALSMSPSATASASAATSAAAPAPLPLKVTVTRGQILSCKSEAGDSLKGKECGGLAGLDPIVQARLKKVAQAPNASGNTGKLSIVLGLDFGANKVTSVDVGKSSTVKDGESYKTFLSGDLKAMSLKSIDHENVKYQVAYTVTVEEGAPGTATPTGGTGGGATTPDADGTATVAWEVAIVRDTPHTGTVLARLPRGSKVQLGTSQNGWYKIKYGPGFASEGWVYRGAVGK